MSLSVGVLFGIFSQALTRTRQDNRTMDARALAQSLLAQAEAAPSPGDSAGVDALGFSWRLHVAPIGGGRDRGDTGPQIATASVTVRWSAGQVGKSLGLITLVLVPKQQEP